MITLALVANGDIHDYSPLLPQIKSCEKIIAVDGGLVHCHAMGLTPDLIIGDFDSIDSDLLDAYAAVEKKRFPIEKNETDLELAVAYALTQNVDKVLLFGALGKRLDHTINNLYLLARHPDKLIAITEEEQLFVISGETILTVKPGQVLSLLPLFGKATVSTEGLKWSLNEHVLDYHFLSQSNIALKEQIRISVKDGVVLCALRLK